MTKAGGSIQTFSESTYIEALIKACKMMKIKKKSYLYNSTAQAVFDSLFLILSNSIFAVSAVIWPEQVSTNSVLYTQDFSLVNSFHGIQNILWSKSS